MNLSGLNYIIRQIPELRRAFSEAMQDAWERSLNELRAIEEEIARRNGKLADRLAWKQREKDKKEHMPAPETTPARKRYERQFTGRKFKIGGSKK